MRQTGKTWRKVLRALQGASKREIIIFISDTLNHSNEALSYALGALRSINPSMFKYNKTERKLFIAGGIIYFTLQEVDQRRFNGLENVIVIKDLN